MTGCPGVGKTSTAGLLGGRLRDVVVAEMDLFTQPELDTDSRRMMLFLRSWLKLGAALAQGGSRLLVAGFARPGELESVPERRYFTAIHVLALVCDEESFTRRVRARQRHGHLPEGDFSGLHALNAWFRTTAADEPNVTVLDNTHLTVDEAADAAAEWARIALQA
jgi:hypothetical protein